MTADADMSQPATSRVIVKSLPKRIDEKRLRSHFGVKGTITDVRLMHTPSGVFRRFAYIGFSSAGEAAAAVAFFHQTYMDTTRIEVYPAKAVGDPDIPRPWSRHTAGSSQHTETQKRLEGERKAKKEAEFERAKAEVERKRAFLKSIYQGEEEDPELAKFLASSRPKSKTRTWENDDEMLVNASSSAQSTKGAKSKKPRLVSVVPVENKKPGGEGLLLTKTHVTFDSDDDVGVETGEKSSDDELYEDFVPNRSISDIGEGSSDMHDVVDFKGESHVEKSLEEDESMGNKMGNKMEKELKPELITETARLFVRNLAYSCTEQDLLSLFESYGQIEEVHVSLSRETKRAKGFAHVKFANGESALTAYQQLDGSIFQGRLLHILPATAKPEPSNKDTKGTYKTQKLAKQRANAGKDFNWNSLFIRSDTVLDAIAAQLGVSKAEIMSPSSENLAIRLATAETHLIADTKKALEEEGADLSVFESNKVKKRSQTVLIVKNLPFDTDRQEIVKLFAKFGPMNRTIFPPTKALAVVEFLEANDAKTAFRSLAYSKFHNSPLFLEFAPEDLFPKSSPSEHPAQAPKVIVDTFIPETNSDSSSDTLYVKNINFDTTEETLHQVFSLIGPLRSVTIPRKRDLKKKRDVGLLSMGFAFVQFVRHEHATLALDKLQGRLIDGHAIVVRRSASDQRDSTVQDKQGKERKGNPPSKASSISLMVRNIPFEATESEVRQLFCNFAQIKRVRLPRKFDGGHRGFGFVDFCNAQEARAAMASLSHTHLYGRHLVLEFAEERDEGGDLDKLRDKAYKNAQRLQHSGPEEFSLEQSEE